jgi:hypothetical protein
VKHKKSRLHEDAIKVLDQEIARCEAHTEYSERAKIEWYTRARSLLLAKRREAEAEATQANGVTNGKGGGE